MAGKDAGANDALTRRLERLSTALGTPGRGSASGAGPTETPAKLPEKVGEGRLAMRGIGVGGASIGIALIAVAIATGNLPLLIPGGLLLLAGAVLSLFAFSKTPEGPLRPKIGAGADVAADAVIEPGATVEMGATVGAGARICRGAVVRMGATVEAGATVEEDAVVGWGVDVKQNAVVERGARVGAGATVKAGAIVPAGMRLAPGTDWGGKGPRTPATTAAPSQESETAAPRDPRLERIDAACDRIAGELRDAPEAVKGFLGASAETAGALRTVCLGLLDREKVLRAEASDAAISALEQEKAALEARIASTSDERIRGSLRSAISAIEDQKRQRLALKTSADRLDAELTRLQWTLEGIATQMMRLRTMGTEVTASASGEIVDTVQQLHDEIDAISEALEHAGGAEAAGRLEPIADLGEAAEGPGSTPKRNRTR